MSEAEQLEATSFATILALAKLTSEIEALATSTTLCDLNVKPLHRTPGGTQYIPFSHGKMSVEGEQPWTLPDPVDIFDATLAAVSAYRAGIPGDVMLTWRTRPQYEKAAPWRNNVYLRLAFEPVRAA